MGTMSTHWLWRWRLIFACAAALSGAAFGAARAVSLADAAPTQLMPSQTPSLLGPISESGRKGWDCTPEHAAAAVASHDAELPSNSSTP